MPSPFPGMDPFLEGQVWPDFHTSFMTVLRDQLVPQVKPRYVVRLQQEIYLVSGDDAAREVFVPDVHVAESGGLPVRASEQTVTAIVPMTMHLPVPQERREAWIQVIDRKEREVVTVIEVLSPTNKANRRGRTQYIRKRERLLSSFVNLVELDLLRLGKRLPTIEPLQPHDYFAFVSDAMHIPEAKVYGWNLRDRLPSIPVPLTDEDSASLNLSEAFNLAYDRGGYDYSIDYGEEITPPLSEEDQAWAQEVIERNRHAR